MYLGFILELGFDGQLLLEGSAVALLFLTGDICRNMAFRDGPGGPIIALVGTLVIYQTALNALVFE